MALRPILEVIVARVWAGGESYNGQSKPPGAFFLGLFLFCSGHYNYQDIFTRISLKCSHKSNFQHFFLHPNFFNPFSRQLCGKLSGCLSKLI